jgi:hypothetical protein
MTTMSTCSSKSPRQCRNHSRIRRFTRFRTTAPPSFRLAVTPSLRRGRVCNSGCSRCLAGAALTGATSNTKSRDATRIPDLPPSGNPENAEAAPTAGGFRSAATRQDLLRAYGDRQLLATLHTPSSQDITAPAGLHARTKSVLTQSLDSTRLVGSLHPGDLPRARRAWLDPSGAGLSASRGCCQREALSPRLQHPRISYSSGKHRAASQSQNRAPRKTLRHITHPLSFRSQWIRSSKGRGTIPTRGLRALGGSDTSNQLPQRSYNPSPSGYRSESSSRSIA